MPVEDHPIHRRTRHTDATLHAECKAAVRKPGYWVKERIYRDGDSGRYDIVDSWVEDVMSKKCRNIDYATTRACDGCPQEKDHEYINKMKELK